MVYRDRDAALDAQKCTATMNPIAGDPLVGGHMTNEERNATEALGARGRPLEPARAMEEWVRLSIGLVLLASSLLLLLFLIKGWPTTNDRFPNPVSEFLVGRSDFDAQMFVVVLLAGALGSMAHSATSFATYAGNRQLIGSWVWWYVLRVPVGMILAVVVYLALRGGLLGPAVDAGTARQAVNPFGFAAIGALAGMFSRQATDKLREVFDTVFRTQENEKRLDKLGTGTPKTEIQRCEPDKVDAGAQPPAVSLIGSGFKNTLTATVGGKARGLEWKSATSLVVELKPDDVKTAGPVEIALLDAGKPVASARITVI